MSIQTFNEQPIRTVVTKLLDRHGDVSITKEDIFFEIIKYLKSNIVDAEKFFNAMINLGLENCKDGHSFYSICKFAVMRDYITEDDVNKIKHNNGPRRGAQL